MTNSKAFQLRSIAAMLTASAAELVRASELAETLAEQITFTPADYDVDDIHSAVTDCDGVVTNVDHVVQSLARLNGDFT